jgi:hypothetical protein
MASMYDSLIPDFTWALSKAMNPYDDKTLRIPMHFTNSYRELRGIPGISLSMNPTSVSFRRPKRISERKTQGGSTFFHWTDSSGRNNDIMTMDFRGQTGNINLRRAARLKYNTYGSERVNWLNEKINDFEDLASSTDHLMSPAPTGADKDMSGATKLVKFWDLYKLTTEPLLDPTTGIPISSVIYYASPLFGNMYVKFYGHFNSALEFEDTADSPFNKMWSFGFTVTSSQPNLNQIYEAVTFGIGQQFNNNLG